jgi:hypothetical protein
LFIEIACQSPTLGRRLDDDEMNVCLTPIDLGYEPKEKASYLAVLFGYEACVCEEFTQQVVYRFPFFEFRPRLSGNRNAIYKIRFSGGSDIHLASILGRDQVMFNRYSAIWIMSGLRTLAPRVWYFGRRASLYNRWPSADSVIPQYFGRGAVVRVILSRKNQLLVKDQSR